MSKVQIRLCPNCKTLFPLKEEYFGCTFSCPCCHTALVIKEGETTVVKRAYPEDRDPKEIV